MDSLTVTNLKRDVGELKFNHNRLTAFSATNSQNIKQLTALVQQLNVRLSQLEGGNGQQQSSQQYSGQQQSSQQRGMQQSTSLGNSSNKDINELQADEILRHLTSQR